MSVSEVWKSVTDWFSSHDKIDLILKTGTKQAEKVHISHFKKEKNTPSKIGILAQKEKKKITKVTKFKSLHRFTCKVS